MSSDPYSGHRHSRRARIGLLVLLILTVLLSGGALLIKYKLEGLRAVVESEVQARTGARFSAGAVLVNGLRGIRIDEVQVSLDSESGPEVSFRAPVAYVHIDIVELLYGNVVIERVEADGTAIEVTRPGTGSWLAPEGLKFPEFPPTKTPSFRLTGKDCSLELSNAAGDARLLVSDFAFDLSRLQDSPDITAKCSGKIAPDADRDFKIDLRYASMEDFDLRLHCAKVFADDVAALVPDLERVFFSGSFAPSIRVAGYPDMMLIFAFEAPFRDVALRNQPNFLMPADGMLSGMAQYDGNEHLLTVTAAKAESYQFGGNIEGTVSFGQSPPLLDLKLEAAHLPLKDAVDSSIAGRADQLSSFDITFQEPYQLRMTLKGAMDKPVIGLQGDAAGGTFSFVPKDASLPKGSLTFGRMTVNWSSEGSGPVGTFAVSDGKFSCYGIDAGKVTGTVTLEKDRLVVEPLNAEITEAPFVGSLRYDLKTKKSEISASGTVKGLESTALGKMGDLVVSGSANVSAKLVKDGSGIVLDGEVDATQAEIRLDDLLCKPAGVGAAGKKVHARIRPSKEASFAAEISLASCQGKVEGKLEKQKVWRLTSFTGNAGELDVGAAGQCIRSAYRISGGAGRDGVVNYVRFGGGERDWNLKGSVVLDDLTVLADGAEVPMRIEGAEISVDVKNDPERTGLVGLKVKKAQMPPLRSSWFGNPKDQGNKPDRHWDFDLRADYVDATPWKGRDFTGKAYVERKEAGFKSFSAKIEGGGRLDGTYHRLRADNFYEVDLKWDGVQVTYLIDQLNYPHVVSGPSSGQVRYSIDLDDPGTLKGQGRFSVSDGQFSADYLISQLEGRVKKNKITSLPLSLRFNQLESRIDFEKDEVRTGAMSLHAPGIKVTGSGTFVLHGDMDYDLKVALSPELAEKIPAIRDNLNVKGLRMAQQDVELAFKVNGPTFNPQGELTGTPPVGITLVSSALELTSNAVGVIDIPRKVLVDLLRIGGGIVGMK